MSTLLQKLKIRLEKIEKELEKVRGCSPLTHGWQTQRYAKASRKWDKLSEEKEKVTMEIENEHLRYFDGNWVKVNNCHCLPNYYECVLVELSNGEKHEAWLSSDGESYLWTKFGTNKILEGVQFFMRYKLLDKNDQIDDKSDRIDSLLWCKNKK